MLKVLHQRRPDKVYAEHCARRCPSALVATLRSRYDMGYHAPGDRCGSRPPTSLVAMRHGSLLLPDASCQYLPHPTTPCIGDASAYPVEYQIDAADVPVAISCPVPHPGTSCAGSPVPSRVPPADSDAHVLSARPPGLQEPVLSPQEAQPRLRSWASPVLPTLSLDGSRTLARFCPEARPHRARASHRKVVSDTHAATHLPGDDTHVKPHHVVSAEQTHK